MSQEDWRAAQLGLLDDEGKPMESWEWKGNLFGKEGGIDYSGVVIEDLYEKHGEANVRELYKGILIPNRGTKEEIKRANSNLQKREGEAVSDMNAWLPMDSKLQRLLDYKTGCR